VLKSTKSNFGWGSAQTPLGRLQRSPHPLTGEERLAVPPKHATPPRPFVPRYSPPLVSRYSAPGTDEIYNFRCKGNNAIYIYTIYRGSAYIHIHGLSVHFGEKYSICRVGRPGTSVKCVVPLTSKIVYFVRPTTGKASREIYTHRRVKKQDWPYVYIVFLFCRNLQIYNIQGRPTLHLLYFLPKLCGQPVYVTHEIHTHTVRLVVSELCY